MVPPGTTCLGVEYFCFEGDEIWEMPDEEAVALATGELARIGLIDPAAVIDGVKVRVPKAYPMYDGDYARPSPVLRGYLAGFDNLKTCGRNGLHRYNNQDHSMWTAILATLNLVDGAGLRRLVGEHRGGVPRGGRGRRLPPRCRPRRLTPSATVSVVIGSNGTPGSVEACLAALEPQCGERGDHRPRGKGALVPELWREGIDAASGDSRLPDDLADAAGARLGGDRPATGGRGRGGRRGDRAGGGTQAARLGGVFLPVCT